MVVGHLPSSGMPTRLRRPGARVGREVRTWIIEDPSGEIVKQRLSAEDLRLPIAVIWNQELLAQRVAEGWRPEMELLAQRVAEGWRPEMEGSHE